MPGPQLYSHQVSATNANLQAFDRKFRHKILRLIIQNRRFCSGHYGANGPGMDEIRIMCGAQPFKIVVELVRTLVVVGQARILLVACLLPTFIPINEQGGRPSYRNARQEWETKNQPHWTCITVARLLLSRGRFEGLE